MKRRQAIGKLSGIAAAAAVAPAIACSETETTETLTAITDMESEDFFYQDGVDLAAMIKRKEVSCFEVMEAYLKRIAKYNPTLNLVVSPLDPEKAMDLAREADRQLATGDEVGMFHGLPHAVKELSDVKGWRTTMGWKAGAELPELAVMGFGEIKDKDGLIPGRMRDSGLLIIGKTNVPDFGFGSHSKNGVYGVSRNPYDSRLSVGGSSGGAAGALAAGLVPVADGSDLGGSLRNPAGFCGVVGFRPSIGRVPSPDSGFGARMATSGPMGRSVRDVASLLAVQAGPDPSDPLSWPEEGSMFLESLKSDPKGKRVAFTPDFGSLITEPDIVSVSAGAVPILESMGVQVDQGAGTYPDIMKADNKGEMNAMEVFRIMRVLNVAGAIRGTRAFIGVDGIRKHMNVMSQYQMIEAYDAVDKNAIYDAEANRTRIYGMFMDYFKVYDFLVCPTTQVMPFPVEADYVRSINGKPMKDYLQWMSVCCVLSITRLPVISMPGGFNDAGLPVGVQIVGKPGADFELLQFAQAFEDASRFSPKFKGNRPDMSKIG